MNSQAKSFKVDNNYYKLHHCWDVVTNKEIHISLAELSVRETGSSHTFIAHACPGLVVCENFAESSCILEVSTGDLFIISMDLSYSESPEAILAFNTGSLLRLNILLRSRGEVVWLNTSREMYSKGSPSLVRWVDGSTFVAFFTDNTMWVFSNECKVDDENLAKSLRGALKKNVHFSHSSLESDRNPKEVWHFSMGRVEDAKFTDDLFFLATGDGQLKVFNFRSKDYLMTFYSYFAGFSCLAVSPSLQIVAVGGQDDSVSVWSYRERRLVARCNGHASWVAAIEFDLQNPNLMFSVGHDGKLVVWELSDQIALLTGNPGDAQHTMIPYPQKQAIPLVECKLELQLSPYSLVALAVCQRHLFVCEDTGRVVMWSKQIS